jgi:hypothetical protein
MMRKPSRVKPVVTNPDDLDVPLVDRETGAIRIGRWPGPIDDPNIEDATIPHALSRFAERPVLGRLEATYRRRWRLKIWQYMSIVTDGWLVAVAVADAGFAGNAFVYAVNTRTGEVRHRLVISPLAGGARIAGTSTRGGHRFHSRGLDITVDNRDRGRSIAMTARGDFSDDGGGFELAVQLDSGTGEHLGLCVPLPTGRWGYTHKYGAYAVSGTIKLAGVELQLDPKRSFGTMDYSKMYALRHAVWKWIALCGASRQGPVVAINLVDPTPVAPVSENVVWVDGALEPVGGVRLEVAEPGATNSAWRVRASGIDLAMRPVGCFEQRLDVPLIRHRLRHGVGGFTGRIETRSGAVYDLENAVGIAEDNDTWW